MICSILGWVWVFVFGFDLVVCCVFCCAVACLSFWILIDVIWFVFLFCFLLIGGCGLVVLITWVGAFGFLDFDYVCRFLDLGGLPIDAFVAQCFLGGIFVGWVCYWFFECYYECINTSCLWFVVKLGVLCCVGLRLIGFSCVL